MNFHSMDRHTMRSRKLFRCFLLFIVIVVIFSFILLIAFGYNEDDIYMDSWVEDGSHDKPIVIDPKLEAEFSLKNIPDPIVLWWTPFTGDQGTIKKCGKDNCFFTINRHYRSHPNTQVFVFYGTDFKLTDLPLPRKPHHQWALLHEESPKNNFLFSHEEVMTLFNHTSTFKRESDYPITTQYFESLQWLESKKHMVSTAEKNRLLSELSPLIYTHSDCGTPSDRDSYTKLLMKHINVDSYGTCIHNKDLPKHLSDPIKGMDHEDFYKLNGKYKFSLAFENAICDDYITEKLWRPLVVGSIPVVIGSPKVKDFLPSNHSAIVVDDFNSVKELANYLKFLNENDAEYEKYLEWKKTGVSNPYLKKVIRTRDWRVTEEMKVGAYYNFIEGFECYVCNKIHENQNRVKSGQTPLKFQAKLEHYGCPPPTKFDSSGKRTESSEWNYDWQQNRYIAKAFRRYIDNNQKYTVKDLHRLAAKMRREDLK